MPRSIASLISPACAVISSFDARCYRSRRPSNRLEVDGVPLFRRRDAERILPRSVCRAMGSFGVVGWAVDWVSCRSVPRNSSAAMIVGAIAIPLKSRSSSSVIVTYATSVAISAFSASTAVSSVSANSSFSEGANPRLPYALP